MKKPRVMIVGAFRWIRGGIGMDCKSLMDSPLWSEIDWIKIESGMISIPPPGVVTRTILALRRLGLFFVKSLSFPPTVILFCSSGGSFYEKGLMAVWAKLLGSKVTICPRSGIFLDDLRKSKLFSKFAKFVFNYVDYVVCQGPSWKLIFENVSGQHSDKYVIISNMLDLSDFISIPKKKQIDERINVLMMGWLDKNKGVFDLVEVVASNRDKFENFVFTLCGLGADEKKLRDKIKENGLCDLFKLPGWVDGTEKINYLKEADIYLMLSYREGLPNALVEAMAAGKAVIATNVGAIPDVVEHEKNGLICNPGDIAAIRDSILKLSKNVEFRTSLSLAARAYAVKKHDVKTCAHLWKAVLPLNK